MDAQRVAAAFRGAFGGRLEYDAERHDPEALARRIVGRSAVVSSNTDQLLAEGRAASRPYFDRIRAEARRRNVPGY